MSEADLLTLDDWIYLFEGSGRDFKLPPYIPEEGPHSRLTLAEAKKYMISASVHPEFWRFFPYMRIADVTAGTVPLTETDEHVRKCETIYYVSLEEPHAVSKYEIGEFGFAEDIGFYKIDPDKYNKSYSPKLSKSKKFFPDEFPDLEFAGIC